MIGSSALFSIAADAKTGCWGPGSALVIQLEGSDFSWAGIFLESDRRTKYKRVCSW